METPQDGSFLEEDDETARAYEAISQQLEQWTSPRMPATNSSTSGWTNVSGSFMGLDDDDDGLVITKSSGSTAAATAAATPKSNASTSKSKPYTPSSVPYERHVMDWWNRELVDPAPRDDEDEDELASSSSNLRVTRTLPAASTTTPKKTGERASTPVMSNSSNKKKSKSSAKGSTSTSLVLRHNVMEDDDGKIEGDEGIEEDEDMLPVNVQSPWVQQQQQEQDAEGNTGTHPPASPWMGSAYTATTPRAISPFRSQQYEYRRYHDGLLAYLKARRSLSDRIDINREEQALTNPNNNDGTTLALTTTTTTADPKLVFEETKAELDFLRTLKSLCWERDPPSNTQQPDLESRREGNFWALLHELRGLGFAALLWTDDGASLRQNSQAAASFFEASATKIHASPKELLDHMTGDNAPLVLKRRKQILNWMQHCLDQLVPADTKTSVSMANSDDSRNFASLAQLGGNTDKVLQSCLELILAGRLDDARMILRKSGQPWMAAKLGGGAPAGIERVVNDITRSSELVKVGNTNRALWKQQMWKLSAKLNKSRSEASPVEAGIHSILANDYRAAMENPALRSWEKGLFVVLNAMWGRSEDELLHLHNNHRRRARPPFPGTQYQPFEKTQLQGTCQLSNMTEVGVVELLAASPFEEMKGQDHRCRAIAALLVGRMSLMDFLVEETETVTNPDLPEEPERKVERLRFVTHLLLYLDSLSACTTPVSLGGIHEYKNKALYAYVDHLANNEDLWHLLVLYASLLPEDVILSYFPGVLARVEGKDERLMMIQQARDLFPGDGLDLSILRIVVRLMLEEQDDAMAEDSDAAIHTPTRSDIRKMKAIQWLCFFEEHMGDALIAANMLIRQFLLDGKLASAIMFLHDFLPPEVTEVAMTSNATPNKEDSMEAAAENERYRALVGNARTEYIALHSYLKAFRAFEEWDLVVKTTPASVSVVDDKLDSSALNEREQAVARSMERRDLVRQKRKVSQVLVEAAETGRKDLMNVLLHVGGWLADSDKDTGFKDDSEEGMRRKTEIHTLRARFLPNAVNLLHTVCADTATWMWSSLLEASPELGSTPKEVLEALDDSSTTVSDEESDSPLSPLSPKYWTQKALSVAEAVASDEFLILEAFGAAELKEMLAKLSAIAVQDLMYSA